MNPAPIRIAWQSSKAVHKFPAYQRALEEHAGNSNIKQEEKAMKAEKLFNPLSHYASAALLVLPLSVSAQSNYPNKPIRFVVGVAAGG